mgnify:CR=1 FL=1
MRAKTEELLYHMLWACDMLWRPSYRHCYESFEGWAYRKGVLRKLRALQHRKLVESETLQFKPAFRLTKQGIRCALGGEDPESLWSRPWSGRWHLVLFDVPNQQVSLRNQLRNRLRESKLGWLQRSVWVSPHPITSDDLGLSRSRDDVRSLIFLEAVPAAGERDAQIVKTSWDFDRINRLYATHAEILAEQPQTTDESTAAVAEKIRGWAERERAAWKAACVLDPFLPRPLLPGGYQGCQAWERRKASLRAFGSRLRAFGVMDP